MHHSAVFQADDPDTKKQVTYVIKQGDTELFSIDSKTGVIKTIRGLDFERESQHVLIIGTVENTSNLSGATTRVVINVQDVNDNPPVFTMVPRPTRLDDTVSIGTTVMMVQATDSDGTTPGNQVSLQQFDESYIVGFEEASTQNFCLER